MGAICLSTAGILRCAAPTDAQEIALFIPTALEVVVVTSLVFILWGSGKRHLLIAAEGWIYLILSLLELLSDVIPAVRGNIPLYRSIDMGIGVASFLPIFFYTFFLFLFTSAELTETYSRRVNKIAKLTLILFVPAIVVFNEIASFIGVSIREARELGIAAPSSSQLVIGFNSNRDQSLWYFFTSLTLAFLVVFQATVFLFAFYRLVQAITHQRQIERRGGGQRHLLKGLAWFSAAMKLGAFESVIGFAGGSFEISMTRRCMRLASRLCLVVGIIKGVDVVEDLRAVRSSYVFDEKKQFRRSRLAALISGPRLSTFRELSPTAQEFHAAPRAPPNFIQANGKLGAIVKPPHYLTYTQRQSLLLAQSETELAKYGLPGMEQFASMKEKHSRQRVTVHYNLRDGAPTLQMRFSMLDVPSPAVIVERVKSRPISEWDIENYKRNKKLMMDARYKYTLSQETSADALFDIEQGVMLPPKPHFSRNSHLDSPSSGQYSSDYSGNGSIRSFEIVSIPQRKFSQTRANPRVVNAGPGSILETNASSRSTSPDTVSDMEFAASSVDPQPPITTQRPRIDTQQTGLSQSSGPQTSTSDLVSAGGRSVPDSLAAMHELTSQFPGPPTTTTYLKNPRASILWEEESNLRTPSIIIAHAVGSPSELTFGGRGSSRAHVHPTSATFADENGSWGNSRASSVMMPNQAASRPQTPGEAVVVPIVYAAGRMPVTYTEKPIDPFSDDDSSLRRPSLADTQVMNPSPPGLSEESNNASEFKPTIVAWPVSAVTPSSALSGFTQIVESSKTSEDMFSGDALDTGKSKQFKTGGGDRTSVKSATRRRTLSVGQPPSSARVDKLSRIAEWVDNSKTAAALVETMPKRSLQDLHERGQSIDNLSIPWLKDGQHQQQQGQEAAPAVKAAISRFKSVGKVAMKSTPPPTMHVHAGRISMHLQPLVIPPRSGDMPVAVQDEAGVYGSLDSFSGRGVLRDSEVLGLEDPASIMRQSMAAHVVHNRTKSKPEGNYF